MLNSTRKCRQKQPEPVNLSRAEADAVYFLVSPPDPPASDSAISSERINRLIRKRMFSLSGTECGGEGARSHTQRITH
eukprot:COSAG02_NODE_785_length_17228_cov_24.082141_15_plen_78_part_00